MKSISGLMTGLMAVVLMTFGQVNAQEEKEMATLSVGDTAPDFDLPSSDGNNYKLSEVLKDGPVVLAWFPKADTPGCTAQCKSMAKNGPKIREFQVSYFMISVDPVEDNKKFAEKYSADFPILSDTTKETAKAYGVMSGYGFSNRHTFYIGTDQKILKIDRKINVATAAEDTVSALEELEVDRAEST